ncbi:MAG: hypothetical protein QM733_18385 [Ilumatobacteraceae bacterium]
MRETSDTLRKAANLDFEPQRVDGDTGQPAQSDPVPPVAAEPVAPAPAPAPVAPDDDGTDQSGEGNTTT